MSSIEEQTRNLIEAIRLSHEYQHFHRMYEEAKKDTRLLKELNEYRRKSFRIQLESETCLEDGIALKEEFKDLVSIPMAREFLNAEVRFCKMIREMNDSITEGLNLDTGFLEETL